MEGQLTANGLCSTMRFWIEGEPFAFGPSAFIRSKLLSGEPHGPEWQT
jgi:hypothetical protein